MHLCVRLLVGFSGDLKEGVKSVMVCLDFKTVNVCVVCVRMCASLYVKALSTLQIQTQHILPAACGSISHCQPMEVTH